MQSKAIANPLIGPRSEPAVFRSAANDLAVVIDQERRRRGVGIYAFGRQLGMSDSRIASFSRFLRGDDSSFGYLAAVRLAERIGIPMVLVVGDEAREIAA